MAATPSDKFAQIAASVPVNRTAAIGTSRGVHYDPTINFGDVDHRESRPLMREIPRELRWSCADIPGTRLGRMVIIGLAAEYNPNPKAKARWVARCDCGCYEFRKAKWIRNARASKAVDMCKKCSFFVWKKERYSALLAAERTRDTQPEFLAEAS